MSLFGEDDGLIKRKTVRLRALPSVPFTGWKAPTEFPNLSSAWKIGVDTETYDPELNEAGPGWARHRGHIVGVSLAAIDYAGNRGKWYFPMRHEVHPEDNMPDAQQVLAYLRHTLSDKNQPKVFAHAQYDVGWLAEEGVKVVGPIDDVQYAEACIDNNARVALDILGNKYLHRGKTSDILKEWVMAAYKPPKDKWRREMYRTPPSLAGPYGEDDAMMPLELLQVMGPLLDAEDLYRVYRMECDLIPMEVAMRFNGVHVNVGKAEQLKVDLEADVKAIYEEIYKDYGFVLESTDSRQIGKLLDVAGIKFPTTPKLGIPKIEAEWLDALDHPLGEKLGYLRELEKMIGTFITSYILNKNINGILYPSFHPLRGEANGTMLGRFSSSDPNLQNIPTRTKLGKRVREAFEPRPGRVKWRKHDYCIAPHMRVLTDDLRWVRADELTGIETLIAFDEEKSARRRVKFTRIQGIKWLTRPSYRITMSDGRVLDCSGDHRWLAKRGYSATYDFVKTENLKLGWIIGRFSNTWEQKTTYEAGWLAGMFDGEGSRVKGHVQVSQNPGRLLDRCAELLTKFGYAYINRPNQGGCGQLQVNGGRMEILQLLGELRPLRLIKDNKKRIEGEALQTTGMGELIIVKLEYLGEQPVIAIETEAKTFIVEGMCSHNSQIHYRILAHNAVDKGDGSADRLRQAYINDPDMDYHFNVYKDVAPVMHWSTDYTQTPNNEGELVYNEEIQDHRRVIKNINFSGLYGVGEGTVGYKYLIGMSKAEVKQFLSNYHAGAPYIKATMEAIASEAERYGFVTTLMGRRIRFNLWEPRGYNKDKPPPLPYKQALEYYGTFIQLAYLYRAVNYKFQGSEPDIMKHGMLDLWNSGVLDYVGVPSLTVHDELDWEQLDDSPEMNEAFRFVQRTMEQTIKLRVPVKVDATTGPNWSKAR